MTTPRKVTIITNIPNPYRIPLFNELSSQLAENNYHLNVLFGALGYARRNWKVDMTECKFDYDVLPSKKITLDSERVMFSYSGLLSRLSAIKPDIVIVIGFSLATVKLALRSAFQKTPFLIWSGRIYRNDDPQSFLRKIQRRILIKKASGYIAYGTKAKEYLISLGAPRNLVSIGINTVDTSFFSKEAIRIRSQLNVNSSRKHLLYVGELAPRKDVTKVLEAIGKLKEIRSDFVLDIVGDGEDREKLEKYTHESNLSDMVNFHGYKQKNDLPQFYAQSSCFLFQTKFDIWGLVLVEAMATGLPCISSINAGATHDLIQEGETGFAMDFEDTATIVDKIDWILNNPERSEKIGESAHRYISEHVSIKKSAGGFLEAITRLP